MELIAALSSQLGLGETEAKGLAGGMLGILKSGLAEQAGPDAAAQLEAQVPEMAAWQAEGDTPPGEPGIADLLGSLTGGGGLAGALGGAGGGSLAGALGGLLGESGGGTAGLAAAALGLVSKFNLDGEKLGMIGGLVSQFLEGRLDGGLLAQAKPLLALLGQGGGSGGLGGLLGGMLDG